MELWGIAMQSPVVELLLTGLSFSSLSHTCTLKAEGVIIRSLLWTLPVGHVLTLLITRFYFSNVSNTILNISQYTACGCSTSSWHPPRDLLLRRNLELAVPRKCCTVSIYQHLIEITMNFLGFNNVTYIYHKVGLFQIMWFHSLDVKECMHCVLTP